MKTGEIDEQANTDPSGDNEIVNFGVSEAEAGARLDAYLAAQITGWSRARLQRLIDAGDVLVNGKVVKPSFKTLS